MSKRERDIFQITKSIGDEETGFAYDVIGKLLSDDTELKEIEQLKKQIPMIREDVQIEILRKDKINNEHQKLNGELRVKLKDETERRKFAENELALIKGIGNNSPEVRNLKAELKEVKADNKKLDDWKIPLYKIYTDDEDVDVITKIIKRGSKWAIGPESEEFVNAL